MTTVRYNPGPVVRVGLYARSDIVRPTLPDVGRRCAVPFRHQEQSCTATATRSRQQPPPTGEAGLRCACCSWPSRSSACGILAWAALLRLALVTRKALDWGLFGRVHGADLLGPRAARHRAAGEEVHDRRAAGRASACSSARSWPSTAYYLAADIRHFHQLRYGYVPQARPGTARTAIRSPPRRPRTRHAGAAAVTAPARPGAAARRRTPRPRCPGRPCRSRRPAHHSAPAPRARAHRPGAGRARRAQRLPAQRTATATEGGR